MTERIILIGFLLFVVVILPVLLLRDYRQKKKVRQIIDSYRSDEDKSKSPEKKEPEQHEEGADPKGWGMNDSPFRERKSGLSWGGGNIKASDASRGRRKKFLKN